MESQLIQAAFSNFLKRNLQIQALFKTLEIISI